MHSLIASQLYTDLTLLNNANCKMRIYSPECQSVLPQRHRIIFFAAVGILFVHSSEETAPIEQNEYETVPTTNINSNNAIVLREESCVRERYHPAENVNECRMLVKKALEDGSIDKSFEDSPIDTLSVEDYQAAVYFDEAINTYTLIEDPRHGLIALPKVMLMLEETALVCFKHNSI